ncbi:MAG: ATP-binding protein [Deltaproteobacteria bacterium]|nr:ATP-binding protein [Deltaproteobacteria bacterium]
MAKKETERKLTMRFAGGLIKHLGLQMYSGAVPAIAELIANAWDAEAENVHINIPLDKPLTTNSVVEVSDDGHGMSFEDCDEKYLVLGRDRRKEEGQYSCGTKKRPVMARKGIGKLAGFGVADTITIETVKEGRLTRFVMEYREIEKIGAFGGDYHPKLEADEASKESPRTTVRLTQLKLKRAISGDQFRRSMMRRFAIYADDFRVWLNGSPLEKKEGEYQFRFPPGKGQWETEEVPGFGVVSWWVGFSKDPIPHEDARGISVLARGKLVQTPWFFGLSGGVYGQHGLQYMTGEVKAEGLDEEVDLIATDRAGVLWEDPKAKALAEWGQQKVKQLLIEWADKRAEIRMQHIKERTRYWDRIQKFPTRERKELRAAIEKLAAITTIEETRLDELVDFLVKAYENEVFMTVIRQLNAASPEAHIEVLELLKEWDVLEAIATAQVVRGRLEVIDKFAQMVDQKVPEKPDMHDLLKDHPWLIDPAWSMVEHEKTLDKVLAKHFSIEPRKLPDGRRRLDFFCLAGGANAIVVEVKRPGEVVGRKELRQLQDYVHYLRDRESQESDPARPNRHVIGYLVCSEVAAEGERLKEEIQPHGMFVRTWDGLLKVARETHQDFFKVVKKRAPSEDPRIEALELRLPAEQ